MYTFARSKQEILDEINALNSNMYSDFFGVMFTSFVTTLTFEEAKPYLRDDLTSDEWKVFSAQDIRDEAVDYLSSAYDKALDQRGISASRSIDHYDAWLWLLFDDEVVNKWRNIEYDRYGAEQLIAAADLLGAPTPLDIKEELLANYDYE